MGKAALEEHAAKGKAVLEEQAAKGKVMLEEQKNALQKHAANLMEEQKFVAADRPILVRFFDKANGKEFLCEERFTDKAAALKRFQELIKAGRVLKSGEAPMDLKAMGTAFLEGVEKGGPEDFQSFYKATTDAAKTSIEDEKRTSRNQAAEVVAQKGVKLVGALIGARFRQCLTSQTSQYKSTD